MTKLKLSSKMHLMVIISVAIIAIGLAMGLVFQFVSNGYFNYGADYSSYSSVSVDFAFVDYANISQNKEDEVEATVKEICDKAFKDAGVSYYASTFGETANGSALTFKFSSSVDKTKIQSAVSAISTSLGNGQEYTLSNAHFHEVQTELGGATAISFGAIALASAMVFQFLYFAIRYRLTAAFAGLLADVHNLAIFVSLLAITRVPVGSSVVAIGAITVLLTMIGCCYLFDKVRKVAKDESFAKLDSFEQVDVCANESIANIVFPAICVAIIAVVLFVLMAISALSVNLILTTAALVLIGAVASVYGTLFFIPAVYSRFKRIGDNFKAKHSKKATKNS